MKELDRWDSQFVWLAKGWVDPTDVIDAAKNIWSHRCFVYTEHVRLEYITHHVMKMLKYLEIESDFFELFAPVSKYDYVTQTYSDYQGYKENAVQKVIGELSQLQIKESGDVILVDLLPLEKDIILNGLEPPQGD